MACEITIDGRNFSDAIHFELADLIADAAPVGVCGDRVVTINSRTDDDEFCDLEDFCVAHGIPFERTTPFPSQMGQEPHKVTFRPGMDRPAVELLG